MHDRSRVRTAADRAPERIADDRVRRRRCRSRGFEGARRCGSGADAQPDRQPGRRALQHAERPARRLDGGDGHELDLHRHLRRRRPRRGQPDVLSADQPRRFVPRSRATRRGPGLDRRSRAGRPARAAIPWLVDLRGVRRRRPAPLPDRVPRRRRLDGRRLGHRLARERDVGTDRGDPHPAHRHRPGWSCTSTARSRRPTTAARCSTTSSCASCTHRPEAILGSRCCSKVRVTVVRCGSRCRAISRGRISAATARSVARREAPVDT